MRLSLAASPASHRLITFRPRIPTRRVTVIATYGSEIRRAGEIQIALI